ncbi:hypothetical protein Patl1_27231 [Pistacia atlantica]|uniref:Uncharacterized protein n=1 Tax=Pistacia atlantica TaxID=434234 RepID=A0ACC1BD41_9ROSI|nr:hypothetical protein Patl1_27231 [Pistacia atlantica]
MANTFGPSMLAAPILSRKHYTHWAKRMKTMLKANGLWDMVTKNWKMMSSTQVHKRRRTRKNLKKIQELLPLSKAGEQRVVGRMEGSTEVAFQAKQRKKWDANDKKEGKRKFSLCPVYKKMNHVENDCWVKNKSKISCFKYKGHGTWPKVVISRWSDS